MPNWLRVVFAILAGFAVWFAVATVGNMMIRWLLPGYTEVEKAMTFTLGMLIARLFLGAVSSLAAGATCVVISTGTRRAVYLFSVLLFLLFVPVHVGLWNHFPVWYHLFFLGSLIPLVLLGAKLLDRKRVRAA